MKQLHQPKFQRFTHGPEARVTFALLTILSVFALRAKAADTAPGLVGEYFSDIRNFKALAEINREPFLVRTDPALDFASSEGDFQGSHLFSSIGVRWTGMLHVDKAGKYQFNLHITGTARLTVNGKVVIDAGKPDNNKTQSGEIEFDKAGDFPLKVEYQVSGGKHACVLSWQAPDEKMTPVPASAFSHEKSAENIKWDKADWDLFSFDHHAWIKKHGKAWEKMDYGPFLSGTFTAPFPEHNETLKGIIVSLDPEHKTNILFDTEMCRYSAGWTCDGDFINYNGVAYDGAHGTVPAIKGTQIFGTPEMPGWEHDGSWKDPRKVPYGNLPADWCHYRGLYRNGDQTVLSYTVNGVGILDTPKYERGPDQDPNDFAICRTLQIDPCPHPLRFVLYEEGAGKNKIGYSTFSEKGDGITAVEEDGKIIVEVAPHDKQIIVGACISPLEKDGGHFGFAFTPDLQKSFTHGGPARWGAPIAVEGELSDPVRLAKEKAASDSAAVEHKQRAESLKGNKAAVDEMNEEMSKAKDAEKASEQLAKQIVQANGPYVVDTITLPFKNPYDAWMRVSGFDFFPDGHSAAVCTWNGDVWIVKGIDDKLDHLTWQRYATGLFQSLGLKIVNGEIYVSGRDQITRLHDLNGDGEADWYENFNNDCEVTDGFHEFQHDLQTDSEGNFFIAKGGPVNPGGRGFQKQSEDNGCMMKISPDGKKCEIYATGMRAPNGTSMGPNDMLTVSDNQGTWVPACRISFVTKGSFLGVPDTSHLNPKPDNYGNPIVWFPYVDGDYTQGDNSSGGAAWDTFGKWGPLDGRCIHLSYGTCSIFELMYENVGGVWQGGVCRFPLDFDSGIMRARFNPVDGQLYVAGLKGWQTRGAKDGCFQRVRYTGKPVHMPTELHVLKGAISITFTSPVDPVSAVDPDNYSIEWWNMIWSSDYGSPDVLRDNPKKKGHDTVDIAGITISDDHKTVTIKIDDLKPVMLMKTIMKIKAADGSPMNWELDNTVNVVPGGPSIAVKQPVGK